MNAKKRRCTNTSSFARPADRTDKRVAELLACNGERRMKLRHFIVEISIQFSACFLFVYASPLFEEESYLGFTALTLNVEYPIFFYWSSPCA